MKKNLPFTLFIFLLVPLTGFAQFDISTDPEVYLQKINDRLLQHCNDNNTLSVLDEDDLLLALRVDTYNTDLETWEGFDSTVYFYNSENRIIESLTKQEVNGVWEDTRRDFNTYDNDGNLTLRLTETWNGTEWVINARNTFEFDANGNEVLSLFEVPDATQTEWTNLFRVTTSWGTEEERLERVFELWNIDLNEWELDNRILFEYNNEMQLVTTYQELWDGAEWTNNIRNTNFYNNDGLRVEFLAENWDGIQWQNSRLSSYEYDTGNRNTKALNRNWEDSEWVNQSQTSFTYQEDGFLIYLLAEQWINGTWINSFEQNFEYDDEDNNTYQLVRTWDINNEAWVNNFRIYYYYQIITDTEELAPTESTFDIFPNPSDGAFSIERTIENQEEESLEVYNTLGQLVHAENLPVSQMSNSLNLEHLGEGMYIIRLSNAESEQQLKKIQIIK